MKKAKQTDKQLIHMKLAIEVQSIALPLINQGGKPKTTVYRQYVVMNVPVCMNTYLKMLKEDVSQYPRLIQEYQQKVNEKYLEQLKARSRKRIKQDPVKKSYRD